MFLCHTCHADRDCAVHAPPLYPVAAPDGFNDRPSWDPDHPGVSWGRCEGCARTERCVSCKAHRRDAAAELVDALGVAESELASAATPAPRKSFALEVRRDGDHTTVGVRSGIPGQRALLGRLVIDDDDVESASLLLQHVADRITDELLAPTMKARMREVLRRIVLEGLGHALVDVPMRLLQTRAALIESIDELRRRNDDLARRARELEQERGFDALEILHSMQLPHVGCNGSLATRSGVEICVTNRALREDAGFVCVIAPREKGEAGAAHERLERAATMIMTELKRREAGGAPEGTPIK